MLAGAGGESLSQPNMQSPAKQVPTPRPNIILICADQMRADFVGGYRENATTKTPNLDHMMSTGATFQYAMTNQPLCSPARACMITGRYATEAGEWKLGLELNRDLPTLASVLSDSGYTTNFIGKWHLMKRDLKAGTGMGFVPLESRGGFRDTWEGANEFEHTTHPYEGTIWDAHGEEISYKDEYRIDFITDRTVKFLRQPHEKPFLLFVSQLEPHQQNDENRVVAPKGYAERFKNPYVPYDLRGLPGDWQEQLPDYYGCVQKVDESVGTILKTLEESGLSENTIVVFISDHGCQFRTRNAEYKRSAHDSSIRIPFIFQGPGFDVGVVRNEIVGLIDLTPTLLAAAGASLPRSMKGKNLLPLLKNSETRRMWKNQALIQISESMVARAIRTKEWTYCVVDRDADAHTIPSSIRYEEYQMYNNADDPAQLVNLAGRTQYLEVATDLRNRLLSLIEESGEPRPTIALAKVYP